MKSWQKLILLTLGIISLTIGIIGIFVPLLPTTPLVILAAFLFKHSSPKLRIWLYHQPLLGKSLQEWDDSGSINLKAKILAVTLIVTSVGYVCIFRSFYWIIKLVAAISAAAIAVFIITRPSKKLEQ